MTRPNLILMSLLAIATLAFANPVTTFWSNEEMRAHDHKSAAMQGTPSPTMISLTEPLGRAACTDGVIRTSGANAEGGTTDVELSCDGVDLLRFIPINTLGDEFYDDPNGVRVEGSDVWGWTSPDTGDEYVIMGKSNATAFFRIIDGADGLPDLENLGELPNRSTSFSVWKDMKVQNDHVFIVAEASAHGLQVFDLTELDGLQSDGDRRFEELTLYTEMARDTHNVVINEDSPYAILVGGQTGDTVSQVSCGNGGLHFVNIEDPANPVFEDCHASDLYVHDAQCVTYHGPVELYQGRELCFNANEQWVSVVDITDKAAPVTVGLFPYPQHGYVHQGWLTEDHAFFMLGDEGDESRFGGATRTMIFDFRESLSAPQLPIVHRGTTDAIDHNMYVKDGLLYQSNYAAGLQILDTAGLYEGTPSLEQIAHFDVFPEHDRAGFVGNWSNYPWFEDGVVAVNSYDGLFLVQVQDEVLDAHEFDATAAE